MTNFSNLVFDKKSHTYYVNDEIYPSVSTCLSNFSEKFDLSIAKYTAKKQKTTEQKVLAQWENIREKATHDGSQTHNILEHLSNVLMNESLDDISVYPKVKGGVNFIFFMLEKGYKIAGTEIKMYSNKYKFAGTCDLLFYNPETGNYVLADYKTNHKDKMYKHYNKKMLKPFGNMLSHSYNKYQLQLSHYQIMLEDAGYKVEQRLVVWVNKEFNECYQVLECTDYTNKLRKYYENK